MTGVYKMAEMNYSHEKELFLLRNLINKTQASDRRLRAQQHRIVENTAKTVRDMEHLQRALAIARQIH